MNTVASFGRKRANSLLQQAFSLHQRGQLAEAASLYHEILAQNPKNADALHLLGVLESQRSNSLAGIELIDRAIQIQPDNAVLFFNRGNVLRDLRRFDAALASYDRALAIKPDYVEALQNRGGTLQDLKRFDDALKSYDQALAIKPDYVKALNDRATVLKELGRLDDALASYEGAPTLQPDYAEALNNRGNALQHSIPPITPGTLDFSHLQELVGTVAPVILEIGANDGATTAALLSAFPDCTIYAFEPDPRAIAKFKNRIKDPRAHLFEFAIGVEDGERSFHVSSGSPPGMPSDVAAEYKEGWDLSGSLRAPKSHKQVWPWVKFESTITVPVRRLDTWAREHAITNVDFIWADVQGAEGDLVAGGLVPLAKTRYFHVEYSNDEWYEGQPTLRQLTEMLNNFVVVRRFPMDVLFRNMTL